jgi:tetratricopeptide (TPR) repeat protein
MKAITLIAVSLLCLEGCANRPADLASTGAPGLATLQEARIATAQTRTAIPTALEKGRAGSAASTSPQGTVKASQKKTIEDLARAVELLPSHAPAYSELGFAYAEKGDYDKAIANYNKALELDRCYDWAFYNRGCAWSAKGDYDRAIDDYNKALECNPRYAEAYNNRGNARFQKAQYDEAFQDYTKAVKFKPRYAIAHYNLGNAWYKKGQHRQAIAEFTKAIQLKPDYRDGFNNRGVTFIMLAQYDEAERDLMTALQLDPDDGSTMVRLAELYSMKNDILEACKWLDRGVNRGYRDFKYIKNTVTFDNIRMWPCYESALSK